MPLETLPVDVLLNIIRRLHPSSLHLVAAVCRRLRRNLDAPVLTYSFAKSHLELLAYDPPAPSNPKHVDCLKGCRLDLPFLKNYALAAGAVFGFSNGLLEMMWGASWADRDVPCAKREMVVSAFRKGIWQILIRPPVRWNRIDLRSFEHAFELAAHLRSLELLDILREAYMKNTTADFNDHKMGLFFKLCIKKNFLDGIDLIPNHAEVLNKVPLMNFPLLVVAVRYLNVAAVSLLLSKGSHPRPQALSHAVSLCNHPHNFPNQPCKPQAAEIVTLLLDAGADPNALDSTSVLPALHEAAISGCPSAVRLCLAAGADPNARAKSLTPLHKACSMLRLHAAKVLLDHGSDIAARGPTQSTVLHAVAGTEVKNPPPAVVRRLIALVVARGAELEATLEDRPNLTPLGLACKRRCVEVAVELLRAGADGRVGVVPGAQGRGEGGEGDVEGCGGVGC
ncbi:hypothetical protein HDU96_001985 [Phlyctochytrium bullatum]|nr:hypothetical protein HDU96_001985 [Phlyctochytrium bullatum]